MANFPKGTPLSWLWENIKPADMVDVEVSDLKAPTTPLDMNSQKITGVAAPTAGGDAVTKDHLDSVLQGLDWQNSVLDELDTPPGSPTAGDRYLVIATATGDWVGHEDDIAEWDGSAWVFTTPNKGYAVWIEDVGSQKTYNGTNWVSFGTTVDHGFLLGLDDDDHSTIFLNHARHDLTERHTLGTVVPHDNLADLIEKDHGSLSGVSESQHHAKTVDDEVFGLIRSGLDASKPAASIAGRFYWATDTKILYRDTGSAWEETARAEAETRLAQLSEKSHDSLTGVTPSQHHAKTGNYEVYGLTEEVAALPGAAAGNLGRFMRERTAAGQVTKLYVCVQNAADGYEWIQLGIST